MKNQRGFAEVAVLYAIIAVMALLFVPNPVSKVVGVGVKPNVITQKQSHTETIEPLLDAKGNQVAFKSVAVDATSDSDQAPKSWVDNLLALPRLWLLLMLLGCFCPVVGAFMANLNGKIKTAAQTAYEDLTGNTKQIVVGVKRGLNALPTTPINYQQMFLDELSKEQDTETENLVKELLKGS